MDFFFNWKFPIEKKNDTYFFLELGTRPYVNSEISRLL